MLDERQNEPHDPLMYSIYLTRLYNPRLSRCIDNIISQSDHINLGMETLKNRVVCSTGSKFISYRTINPSFDIHPVYFRRDMFIPEKYRQSVTRLRVSSHDLRIETGRWSRIPRDRRTCPCGLIQDERHVLIDCPISEQLRNTYLDIDFDFPNILNQDSISSFKLVHEILEIYKS